MRAPPRLLFALSFLIVSAWAQDPTPKPKSIPTAGAPTCGGLTGNVLKCPHFGFTYKVPFGWVDRTDEMQGEDEAGEHGNAPPGKSETLLAIFQRPPGAGGDAINSAVVIATEPLTNYPGIKAAADYFGPIMDVAQEDGFKVLGEPQSFQIGTRQLVRGDFSKERGKLIMWQTSLVMMEKGSIVSFTFVGGSQDEIENLIGGLSFGTRPHDNSATRK
jgi:hypothetical protein